MFDFLKKKIGAFLKGGKEEKAEDKKEKEEDKKPKEKVEAKTKKTEAIKKGKKEEAEKEEKKKTEDKEESKAEKKEQVGKSDSSSFFSKAKGFLFGKKDEGKEKEETKKEAKEAKAEEEAELKGGGDEEEREKEPKGKEKEEEEKKEQKTKVESKEEKRGKEERAKIQDGKEEEKTEEPKEEGFFRRLVNKISKGAVLSKEQFEEEFSEFEITLLENNVALEAVDKIKESLEKSLVGIEIKKSEAEKRVLESLKESILGILIEPPDLIEKIKEKEGVFTILFFGINGTGKTTSIAKIANLLKNKKISCVIAAGDTFRAASIEQLKIHGEKIGVEVIYSQYGSDPASVAFEAKKYAESHKIKVVLIDTAGRMYTKENLLKEMEKIVRVSKPDLKVFVGESITGNDAVEQARAFNESAGIDGIILSKADIDEKAGAILSVSLVTGKPIYFLGTGQGYDDILVFSKKEVLKNLGLE